MLVLGVELGLVYLGLFRVRGRFWLGPGTQLNPQLVVSYRVRVRVRFWLGPGTLLWIKYPMQVHKP